MRLPSLHLIVLSLVLLSCCSTAQIGIAEQPAPADLPNILWLSTEDIGPHLGCYGVESVDTPNLDQFAKRSLVYDIAWSNYPVCAPARTTIIGGMYACANAAGNMRSEALLPEGVEMLPYYLRQAGYYCTNNSKTDYNYSMPKNNPWDESSRKAHYRNRAQGQPFFAVFNHTGTHESKIRAKGHNPVIDPATVQLPAYWPDVPEVRKDFAQYLDNIQTMDGWFQKHLDDLEKAGLSDNTIVVFWGDHGSGMPRHKRFAGDSGQRVPFMVHVPDKLKSLAPAEYAAGARTNRPVGFIDLAPTTLSVAGIEPPGYMQGHAFMGKFQTDAPKYVYGFRDRMDERPDISRSIRDERFIYVRNYMPHLPAGQHVGYQFQTSTTAVWKRLFDQGKLNPVQAHFWQPHPPEEFYDLLADPDETKNLVDDHDVQLELARFRKEHYDSMMRIGDLGLIPESIAYKFGKNQPRRLMLEDNQNFPLDEIWHIADHAANRDSESIPELVKAMAHTSASVRYWAAMGFLVRGETAAKPHISEIEKLIGDREPCVAIVAAELLVKFGDSNQRDKGTETLLRLADLRNSDFYAAIHALNAIDRVEDIANFDQDAVDGLPVKDSVPKRGGGYLQQLVDSIKQD